MITPANIQAQFAADFASVSTGVIQIYIAQAYACMNPDIWAEKLDLGATYLAAHWMTLDGVVAGVGASTLAVGPVASRSAGPIAESYAVAANGGRSINDITDLGMTRYGLVVQRLKRGLVKTPLVDAPGYWPGGGGGW